MKFSKKKLFKRLFKSLELPSKKSANQCDMRKHRRRSMASIYTNAIDDSELWRRNVELMDLEFDEVTFKIPKFSGTIEKKSKKSELETLKSEAWQLKQARNQLAEELEEMQNLQILTRNVNRRRSFAISKQTFNLI